MSAYDQAYRLASHQYFDRGQNIYIFRRFGTPKEEYFPAVRAMLWDCWDKGELVEFVHVKMKQIDIDLRDIGRDYWGHA